MSDWKPLRQLSLGDVGQHIDFTNRSAEHTNILLAGISVESEIVTEANMGGAKRHFPGQAHIRLESVDATFEMDQYALWRYAQ